MAAPADDDTREAMVKAARDLLVSGGLDALSMRKVGLAVGVSATAIYRHFENKEALLSAAVARGAEIFGGYLLGALTEKSPLERLRRMGHRYFDFALEHRHDYQILFMLDCEQIGMHKLDERAQSETASTFQLLIDRVIECQASGDITAGDPLSLSVYIWSALHGLVSLRIAGRMDVDDAAFSALAEQQVERTLSSVGRNDAPPGASVRLPQKPRSRRRH